ncbi:MAG: TIR domain-containing protein [Lachnospiraceae bacterium]|nr:TIR domain-containing protein [Lachnospiraceae bacterium]
MAKEGVNKDGINKDIVQYDAFISYRHSELDSFVAQTLHKQLENFKLPKNVARRKMVQAKNGDFADTAADGREIGLHARKTDDTANMTETVKTRITRVFRDKEELPLVTNLADPITEALQNSEYLIVICSPRLPESMWCRKEIETFIEMHDREHVLAVLIEGEPDTSFPEELLYREIEETGTDGTVIKTRIPVEPLAADVRGTDYKEIRRKIKSELLRLVAPMFDCNYDDLRQRHREQRTRKIIMTSMSISAACLSFGIVSTTMALRISRQNTQIKEQNTQIKAQSDEIVSQAQEIERQYQEAKRNTAISRSKEAVGYLENGDRMRAVATAQDALLDLSESGIIEADVDYPAQAVYALSDSLYLYENGQQILPDRILEADTAVRVMTLSPQGSRILTVDDSGQVIVWNPEDEKEQIRIDAALRMSSVEKEIAFWGEDCVFCPVEDGIALYDVSDKSAVQTYRIRVEDYAGIMVLQEQKLAIVLSTDGYQAVDCTDGSLVYTGEWDMDGLIARSSAECTFSEDGRYWAVGLTTPYGDENERQEVAVYDTATGERLSAYPIEYEYIRSLRFDGDRIYVVSNHSGELDYTQVTLGMESRLQAYDIGGADTPVWTYERHNGWLYETSYAHAENSNYLLCSGYSDVVALDKRDGSYIDLFGLGVEVVKLGNYSGSESFMAFTRDGVWHYLDMNRREDMVGILFPACTSSNVMEFAIGDGYCVTLPYNSRRMTLYRTARGAGIEEFYQGEYNYKEAVLSSAGSELAAAYYNDDYSAAVEVFDTDTGRMLWNYEDDSYYLGMTFFDYHGQETLALITNKKVVILDPENGEQITSANLDIRATSDYLGCNRAGSDTDQELWHRYVYLWDDRTLNVYDLTDMKWACQLPHEETAGYDDIAAVWIRSGSADSGQEDYYVITDKEEGALHFYCMGEEIYTYGGAESTAQQDDINYKYIENMFFDENEQEVHLNIVYKDGRITRLDINPDSDTADFCTPADDDGSSEKYGGLEDVMRRYESAGDYAIMQGSRDAFLLTKQEGDILAQLHGFLCCDSTNRRIYLTNSRTIYRLPLYDLKEINEIATEVRSAGKW